MRPHSRHQPSLLPRNRLSEARFRGLTRCLLQLRTIDIHQKMNLPPPLTPPFPPLITPCVTLWLELPTSLLPPHRSRQKKQFPHTRRPRCRLTLETQSTQPSTTHTATLAAAPMVPRPHHGKWGGLDLTTTSPGAGTRRRPRPRPDRPCTACRMPQTRFQRSCTF